MKLTTLLKESVKYGSPAQLVDGLKKMSTFELLSFTDTIEFKPSRLSEPSSHKAFLERVTKALPLKGFNLKWMNIKKSTKDEIECEIAFDRLVKPEDLDKFAPGLRIPLMRGMIMFDAPSWLNSKLSYNQHESSFIDYIVYGVCDDSYKSGFEAIQKRFKRESTQAERYVKKLIDNDCTGVFISDKGDLMATAIIGDMSYEDNICRRVWCKVNCEFLISTAWNVSVNLKTGVGTFKAATRKPISVMKFKAKDSKVVDDYKDMLDYLIH